MVLGALLLGLIVLFVSCSGGDDDTKRSPGASSQAPTPAPAASTPEEEPSFTNPAPGAGGPSLPDPEDLTPTDPDTDQSGGADGGTGTDTGTGTGTGNGTGTNSGTNGNITAATGTTCGDAEISVTPVPVSTTVRRGSPVEIRLKIKNISARTCARDVGADLQELYIDEGARKIWSSDTCNTLKGSNSHTFPPGGEREFNVTWNGKQDNKCAAGWPAGTAPPAGQYEVRGRLGAKVSAGVPIAITA